MKRRLMSRRRKRRRQGRFIGAAANILSLSGMSGIGENVLTQGLGPEIPVTPPPPPPPPTPPRRKGGGGGSGGGGRLLSFRRRPVLDIREADYAVLPLGVTAVADGELEYFQDDKAGTAARLTTEDGTRYYYGNLGIPTGPSRQVKQGETIGTQPRPDSVEGMPTMSAPASFGVLPLLPAAHREAVRKLGYGDVLLVLGGVAGLIVIVGVTISILREASS